MKATVIYPQDVTFEIDIPEKITHTHNALCYMWEATNPESGNETLANMGLRVRSSMVGDIYKVNGETWMVDGMGFIRVSEQQSVEIQKADSRDRLMSWKWLVDHKLVTGEPLGQFK